MSKTCARCEKTVYPIEELKCLDKVCRQLHADHLCSIACASRRRMELASSSRDDLASLERDACESRTVRRAAAMYRSRSAPLSRARRPSRRCWPTASLCARAQCTRVQRRGTLRALVDGSLLVASRRDQRNVDSCARERRSCAYCAPERKKERKKERSYTCRASSRRRPSEVSDVCMRDETLVTERVTRTPERVRDAPRAYPNSHGPPPIGAASPLPPFSFFIIFILWWSAIALDRLLSSVNVHEIYDRHWISVGQNYV